MESLIKIFSGGNTESLIAILAIVLVIAVITYYSLSDINDGEQK